MQEYGCSQWMLVLHCYRHLNGRHLAYLLGVPRYAPPNLMLPSPWDFQVEGSGFPDQTNGACGQSYSCHTIFRGLDR